MSRHDECFKMAFRKQNLETLFQMSSISFEVRPLPFPPSLAFALLLISESIASSQPPPTDACARLDFNPKITFIVVTKNHKVIFFPRSNSDGDRKGNCRPGTVIGSDVVYPAELDYYLYGNAGLRGTNKPAHYTVLVDENGFTCVVSYFLIQLSSNNVANALLCMTFTGLTAYNLSRMRFVICMPVTPALPRSQLPFSVSSHSPHFCQALLPVINNKSRCTQRMHPRKKPLRPATAPSIILFGHGGNGRQCRSGNGAKLSP